jgi:hypothetical protein
MIFEVTFWIAFIFASRAISKIYYRRRDVLYGPYRATTPCRRSKADEWGRQNFNQWASATGGRRLEHLRAPVRPDITPGRVRRRASRPARELSAYGVRPEVVGAGQNDAFDRERTSAG